jgi:hypothetical protein
MSGSPIEGTPVPDTGTIGDVVTEDLACKHCGHNLRTLSADAVCPECGTPLDYTLRGYYLKHCPPAWLRRVARGPLMLMIATGLAVLGTVGAAVWGIVTAFSGGFSQGVPVGFDIRRMTALAVLAYVPPDVLTVIGILFLTTADPGGQPARDSATRVWLRRSLWPFVASVVLGGILAFAPEAIMPTEMHSSLVAAQAPVGMAIYVLLAVLVFRYFGQLMLRIPRPGLAKLAQAVFWGFLACGVLMTVGQVLGTARNVQVLSMFQVPSTPAAPVEPGGPPPSTAAVRPAPRAATAPVAPQGIDLPRTTIPALAAQAVTGCGGCVLLGFGIAAIVLLVMVCSALYGVAREAEQAATLAPAGSG